MEVNAKVKKVVAVLAIIDDTQKQIRRMKHTFDDQIREIRSQSSEQTNRLQIELDAQYHALDGLLGSSPELDRDMDDGSYISRVKRKSTSVFERIQNKALLYIGQQIVHPEPDEVESGQVLPEFD